MNEVVHTSPTIGSNMEEVKWKNVHFVMWDIGGQESLRQAWSTYYAGTQFLIMVVDSTDRERLTIAREEMYKMLGHEVRKWVWLPWLEEMEEVAHSMVSERYYSISLPPTGPKNSEYINICK